MGRQLGAYARRLPRLGRRYFRRSTTLLFDEAIHPHFTRHSILTSLYLPAFPPAIRSNTPFAVPRRALLASVSLSLRPRPPPPATMTITTTSYEPFRPSYIPAYPPLSWSPASPSFTELESPDWLSARRSSGVQSGASDRKLLSGSSVQEVKGRLPGRLSRQLKARHSEFVATRRSAKVAGADCALPLSSLGSFDDLDR